MTRLAEQYPSLKLESKSGSVDPLVPTTEPRSVSIRTATFEFKPRVSNLTASSVLTAEDRAAVVDFTEALCRVMG